tara:strand:+ start:2599 stop:3267 length:669 start_codon:yes stop_codon:yes gene_type:complete
MKRNRILTESQKRQIIENKEKAILESFASTFNRIKRIDESEINENEEKLSPQEKKVLDDIMSEMHSLNEVDFNSVLDKVKSYAKKGMLTVSIMVALLATPGITNAQSDVLKDVAKIEMTDNAESKSNDILNLSNKEVFNITVDAIKSDLEKAKEWVKKTNDSNIIYMLVDNVGYGKDMGDGYKNADYYGESLKADKETTTIFLDYMTYLDNGGNGGTVFPIY